jgi:hypothetical protein
MLPGACHGQAPRRQWVHTDVELTTGLQRTGRWLPTILAGGLRPATLPGEESMRRLLAEKEVTLAGYRAALERFDLRYENSNDGRRWRAGRKRHEALREYAQRHGREYIELYNAYHRWWRGQSPRPVAGEGSQRDR